MDVFYNKMSKPERLQPLERFEDLVFSGTVSFLNKHYEPRSTDADLGLRLEVQPQGANYRLVGKFFKDQGHVRRFALTGHDVLDVMVACTLRSFSLPLCGLVRSIEPSVLKDLLPLGETRGLPTDRQWQAEAQVEMTILTESDETFPLQLHIERQGPTFYMRRLSLVLPRHHCDAWLQKASLAIRQNEVGVALK